jgi:Zn-dependent protease with chaperone function
MVIPSERPTYIAGITAALLLLLTTTPGTAQTFVRNAARERPIERQLEAVAPAAVPSFRAATAAMDRKDYATAARLFDDVVRQAPGFSPALRRRGITLAQSGQRDAGQRSIEEALAIERSPENLISLAELLFTPASGQTPSWTLSEQALRLAQEASHKMRDDDDSSYLTLTAQISLFMQRPNDFREATTALAARFPDEMPTHYFSAILAAMEGDWIRAEGQIKEAQRRGLPPEAATAFLKSGVARRAMIRRLMGYSVYAFGLWIGGLLLLFVAGKYLSRRTLRSIENADANASSSSSELFLRRTYRVLIVVAASYYYISLPFVIYGVIVGTGLVIYSFMLIGWLPVGLLFALAAGALLTVIKSVQTLFVRVPSDAPGRGLDPAEAPGLWSLAREAATAIGTRPVDEIRVTPGTELAVYEQGTRRERREDRARRVLLLGIGLVDGFRKAPFCAVIAHEYGHFAHRDTAGGELALRVMNDMLKFARVLVESRQAVRWNFAWHFLRAYAFLFRRISHGATRLQEVLADRVAARRYGAANFEEGLRHVVRRHVEFSAMVNDEIQQALEARRALRNVYTLESPRPFSLEHEIDDALLRETSEDDTHPSPQDRFRLVSGITTTAMSVGDGLVWDLFANAEKLATEMTAQIESRVEHLRASEVLIASA